MALIQERDTFAFLKVMSTVVVIKNRSKTMAHQAGQVDSIHDKV